MTGRRFLLACLLPLLGACNMVISETPLFADADKATFMPRDGVWLSNDAKCRFDPSLPESQWPRCAIWIVVKGSTGEIALHDGKGEAQQARFMFAKGEPPIVQIRWRDDAMEDGKTFYVFFGIDPRTTRSGTSFTTAATWEVNCGSKDYTASDVKPYPGISAECRPSSQDAIRSAAIASRSSAEMPMSWRWVRPAGD